jgi:2-oxoisovalerate ferredoxin oxidoreductase beta subunit
MKFNVTEKAKSIPDQFKHKPGADKQNTHYCPGCGHGNLHKMIGESLDELGLSDRAVLISPVGCSVFAYYYFDIGNIQAAHGRAPAVATGVKRAQPHSIVISYQGDGDLAAIGGNNILQAANRGENMTVIFVNNAIYGMTGGQMAPTTLPGQRTTTTPTGRSIANEGSPIRVCELLSSLDAPIYIERVAIIDPKRIAKTRKAIKKALKLQAEGRGFTLVEVLTPCPTGWKLSPTESRRWIEENMLPYFPLGVYRDKSGDEMPVVEPRPIEPIEEVLGIGTNGEERAAAGPKALAQPELVKIAGFGGQGILLLGEILADAGMREGFQVTWLPSYGPEMRGGTANCHVVISNERIGTPMVANPTVLIAMNRPSFEKFAGEMAEGGTILYDSSLIKDVEVPAGLKGVPIPATQIADSLGNAKVANVVMLGAYLGLSETFTREALIEAINLKIRKKDLLPLNEKALDAGAASLSGAAVR